MPRDVEINHMWTHSGSTGGSKAVRTTRTGTHFSVLFTTSSGCTATVAVQTAFGSSAGPWVNLEPSTAMSTGALLLKQYSGPFDWLRSYVTAIKGSTDIVTVSILGC